jgi:hypothetical protein
MALEKGVPTARRNVFLDNKMSASGIAEEFARLKREATEQGFAIAIGHPYAVTLDYLEKQIPLLAEEGFKLVPVSRVIELQEELNTEIRADAAVRQSAMLKLDNEQS